MSKSSHISPIFDNALCSRAGRLADVFMSIVKIHASGILSSLTFEKANTVKPIKLIGEFFQRIQKTRHKGKNVCKTIVLYIKIT